MFTVDLGYYYLTNDTFACVIPELEIAYFSEMERLVLRGNSIDDDGLLDLCDALVGCHNTTLKELDISETQITDRGIGGLIEIMRKCIYTICVVEIEGLREVSKDMRDKLDAALRRNAIATEKANTNKKYARMAEAGKKRDAYDDMGLNYVGKDQLKL